MCYKTPVLSKEKRLAQTLVIQDKAYNGEYSYSDEVFNIWNSIEDNSFRETAVLYRGVRESKCSSGQGPGFGYCLTPKKFLGLCFLLKFYVLKILFIFIFRERGKEGEKEGEKHQ